MAINKFKERQIEAEILGELYEKLENDLKYATKSYERVGKETEQARDYKTGELLWEDDEQTIPKFRDNWDYVDVPEDELNRKFEERDNDDRRNRRNDGHARNGRNERHGRDSGRGNRSSKGGRRR